MVKDKEKATILPNPPYAEKPYRYKVKPGKPRPSTKPIQVDALMEKVAQQLGLNRWVEQLAVMRLWQQVVDAPWDKKSQAVKVTQRPGKGTMLEVRVANPSAASDLRFVAATYCQRLNAYSQQTGLHLDGIEIRVGRLEER